MSSAAGGSGVKRVMLVGINNARLVFRGRDKVSAADGVIVRVKAANTSKGLHMLMVASLVVRSDKVGDDVLSRSHIWSEANRTISCLGYNDLSNFRRKSASETSNRTDFQCRQKA